MKLGDQTIVGFHWPNCDCLLLSELLPGKENSFFLLLSSKIVTFFLLEMQNVSLPVGSATEVEL